MLNIHDTKNKFFRYLLLLKCESNLTDKYMKLKISRKKEIEVRELKVVKKSKF